MTSETTTTLEPDGEAGGRTPADGAPPDVPAELPPIDELVLFGGDEGLVCVDELCLPVERSA